jgi:hypothetical protein
MLNKITLIRATKININETGQLLHRTELHSYHEFTSHRAELIMTRTQIKMYTSQ